MKYIQGIPTCLPTGREEISWNFACKVDKKATYHTTRRFADMRGSEHSKEFARSVSEVGCTCYTPEGQGCKRQIIFQYQ